MSIAFSCNTAAIVAMGGGMEESKMACCAQKREFCFWGWPKLEEQGSRQDGPSKRPLARAPCSHNSVVHATRGGMCEARPGKAGQGEVGRGRNLLLAVELPSAKRTGAAPEQRAKRKGE